MSEISESGLADLAKLFEANSDPAATERLMAYWAEGKGAAKIGWNSPGDFNRCVMHLGKYVADPKGLCSNLHVRATGARPGHAAGEAAMPTPTTLVERATIATTPDVSTGRGIIQVITPGWGSSGYYSRGVLEAAVTNRVFPKGTKMFVDHPTATEEQDRPERSVKDIAAVLTEDAHIDGQGGMVAEIEVLPQFRESLSALARHDAIGCSIRADGICEAGEAEGRSGQIITELSEGKSVDFVTAAGRGGRVLVLESGRLAVTDSSGQATLTTHVPAPAGETTTTPGEPMGTKSIEESEFTRLTEAAGRVTKLEADLTEAKSQRDTALRALAETRAKSTAAARARSRVQEANASLAPATVDRIVESATRSIPLNSDGKLDEGAFDTQVEEARKAEETYLARLAEANGSGAIVGMGGGGQGGADFTEADLDKAIAGAFGRTITEGATV